MTHCSHIHGDLYVVAHIFSPFWFARFFCWYTRHRSAGVFALCIIRAYAWETFESALFCLTPETWGAGAGGKRSYLHEWRENSVILDPVAAVFGTVAAMLAWQKGNTRRWLDNIYGQLVWLALTTGATYLIRFGAKGQFKGLWIYIGVYAALFVIECKPSIELVCGCVYLTLISVVTRILPEYTFAATTVSSVIYCAVLISSIPGNNWERLFARVKRLFSRQESPTAVSSTYKPITCDSSKCIHVKL